MNHAQYERRRRISAQLGRPYTTSPELAQAHVKRLLAAGHTTASIAAKAGINPWTVNRLATRRQGYIYTMTADAVLGVKPEHAAPATVPATGVRRRLQALALRGFTATSIAEHSGVNVGTVRNALNYADRLRATIADALHATCTDFERLPDPTGPQAARTRTAARKRGYAPLAAWDDINNPNERPKGIAS